MAIIISNPYNSRSLRGRTPANLSCRKKLEPPSLDTFGIIYVEKIFKKNHSKADIAYQGFRYQWQQGSNSKIVQNDFLLKIKNQIYFIQILFEKYDQSVLCPGIHCQKQQGHKPYVRLETFSPKKHNNSMFVWENRLAQLAKSVSLFIKICTNFDISNGNLTLFKFVSRK